MSNIKKDLTKYTPREEQQRVHDFIFNLKKENKDIKFFLLNLPTGVGKAQPLYSKILTPDGWKTFENIKEGDQVITPSGRICEVIKLHQINELPVYRITFIDGRTADCTEQHLWKVYSNDYTDKWKVINTVDMIKKINGKSNKLHIPLINDITNIDSDLPIDPYVLGCLIGDGGLTQKSVKFTTSDDFIYQKISDKLTNDTYIKKLKSKYEYYVSIGINKKLESIGLLYKNSHQKFIPEVYKKSSFQQKIQLINGLLDTDGYIDKNGSICFSSCSLRLSKDFQELIWSIGGIATIKIKRSSYKDKNNNKVYKNSYLVGIRFRDPSILFSLPRKKARASINYQYKDLKLKIKSIELINTKLPTRCISINDKEELYITDNYITTHNSHLAMMIANEYISKVDSGGKIDIITSSKILQDQYADSYESITDLKGKDNYKCHQYACSCAQGMEFNKLNKTSCDFCPYDSAKQSYLGGKVSLTNFYLYLIYAIYNPKILESRGAKVLIVDECHDFDDVMSDFISIKITENVVKKLKFTNEYQILKDFHKVKDITGYIKFLKSLDTEITDTIDSISTSMSSTTRSAVSDKRDLKINHLTGGNNLDLKLMQIITDLKQYQLKIEIFLKEYELNPDNWVLETSVNEKTKFKELSLEPIWAYDYLNKYVWCHYDMVILMSGTILNKQIFSDLNGLDSKSSVYYSIPSPFPVENRPIYYMPLGKMSYAKKEETFKKYVPFIHKILKKYKDKKGIIHTNSFELSEWIKNEVENERLIFHDSSNKDEMLKLHVESDKPTVLVSPSMNVGVSFDNDLARFQIIAKVPYPSLASQKNKLRLQNNPDWYAWKTSANIQQSFGRIIRSKNDHGDTIILDASFGDLMRNSSSFLNDWIKSSIKKVNV